MGDRDWRPFIYGGLASITAEFGESVRQAGPEKPTETQTIVTKLDEDKHNQTST